MNLESLMELVADHYGITPADMRAHGNAGRHRAVRRRAKAVFSYLACRHADEVQAIGSIQERRAVVGTFLGVSHKDNIRVYELKLQKEFIKHELPDDMKAIVRKMR